MSLTHRQTTSPETPRLWSLLAALAVALVALLAAPAPALAAENTYAKVSDAATLLQQLEVSAGATEDEPIAATTEGASTVKLTDAVTLTKPTANSSNCAFNLTGDVTLDLAGQKLTVTEIDTIIITGTGTLTIQDSGTGGTLTRGEVEKTTYSVVQVGVSNFAGNLVVNSGTIDGTIGIAINVINGTTTLNGGTLTGGGNGGEGKNYACVQVGNAATLKLDPVPTLNVRGGTICGPEGLDNPLTYGGIYATGDSEVNIYSGATVLGSRALSTNGSSDSKVEGLATINIYGGTLQGASDNAAIYLPSSSNYSDKVNISGGNITGGIGILNIGSELTVGGTAEVTSNADSDEPISVGDAKVNGNPQGPGVTYPPAGVVAAEPVGYNDSTQTTIDGGSISGGVVNGLSDTAVGDNADNAPNLTVSGNADITGDVKNNGAADAQITGGTITGNVVNEAAPKNGTGGDVSMTGGTVTEGVTNKSTGSFDMSGGTVKKDVTNTGAGSTAVTSGTVNGNIKNENADGTLQVGDQTTGSGPTVGGGVSGPSGSGSGSTTIYGGQVDGEVTGDVTNQTPPPVEEQGTAGAVDQQVEGAFGPVENNMSGSATVTPTTTDDGAVWNVEITNGEMPVASVANNLVYEVVSALLRAGANPVSSAQDPSLAVTPGDTYQQVLGFCEAVLNNAVASGSALPADATLADLAGLQCGVVATLADGSTMSYTFAFESGGEPTPPNPPVVQEVVNVYRLYNPYDHLHIYTTDENEISSLEADGWRTDFGGQPAWVAPAPGGELASYEVLRYYNPYSGDHYFVPAGNAVEIAQLERDGWVPDGGNSSIWSADPAASDVEVYTLFNRFNQVDTHLYTASQTELDALVGPDAWEQQATVFWGVPDPLTVR